MKISLLLPYWNRQAAADKALESLRKYSHIDLEIIVVDDGSPVPFSAPEGMAVKVIRMPDKAEPKSPVTCWNEAAKAATGDVLVLSCIEVVHEEPILEELTRDIGKDDYVLASAWCPEEQKWHTHSSVEVPDCPKGTGLGFCAAIRPELYWRAGGFDEAYREGAGYEDRDWIKRLIHVGADFKIRDDLKVIHPKTGASIAWGNEKFQKNLALYRLKWPVSPPVTFVCLDAGNYCGRGRDYVNFLADMVRRNMPEGVLWRFACLTDNSEGLDENIDVIPLPPDLKGWWGKLYLFKPGLFKDGERMIFLDLDTLIVNSLESIIQYSGDMAILRDFYYPERGAPGVILWKAGVHTRIWTEWEEQGRPENPLGDLWWIESLDQGRFTKTLDRIQDLYPKQFVSFKVSNGYLPEKTAVVCFHGHPRPHEVLNGWVPQVWKRGGYSKSDVLLFCNTETAKVNKQIADNCKRDLPWLEPKPVHGGHVCIVGGGPSLKGKLEEISIMQSLGHKVWALNNVHSFLLDNGIKPDAMVILDAREENAEFTKSPREGITYYVASQCHASVFDHLAGKDVILYHNATEGAQETIEEASTSDSFHLLGGGGTVGMKAITIARFLGYSNFHLYGMDSCYMNGEGHAYNQSLNDHDHVMDVMCEGRVFQCAPWMAGQAVDFMETAKMLVADECTISVAGDGLLAYIVRVMSNQQEAAHGQS
jgi:hypothetical protein